MAELDCVGPDRISALVDGSALVCEDLVDVVDRVDEADIGLDWIEAPVEDDMILLPNGLEGEELNVIVIVLDEA